MSNFKLLFLCTINSFVKHRSLADFCIPLSSHCTMSNFQRKSDFSCLYTGQVLWNSLPSTFSFSFLEQLKACLFWLCMLFSSKLMAQYEHLITNAGQTRLRRNTGYQKKRFILTEFHIDC